ncbi:hypothetical protein EYC80_000463 [Monilinia laxa]|uniref:Uncharacterized protein n=1 Tax=Monilinia laxa TaxID=61186 RepID=A0A5N6KAP3_MONLA|nr:hypothetical protein EYC80_000463 [Monilinia laxa]
MNQTQELEENQIESVPKNPKSSSNPRPHSLSIPGLTSNIKLIESISFLKSFPPIPCRLTPSTLKGRRIPSWKIIVYHSFSPSIHHQFTLPQPPHPSELNIVSIITMNQFIKHMKMQVFIRR